MCWALNLLRRSKTAGSMSSISDQACGIIHAAMLKTRAIVHLDMDAFYASVEQRDSPELRGKPVIVGGHPRRGVVLAASYEVRPFGVKSAMSMVEALRRAPHAVVVPPRGEAYAAASEDVF